MGARKKISAEKRKEALKTMYFAKLQNVPTSPRKMRLVADMIRGMEVNRALGVLKFSSKEAAARVEKLLRSAIANWEQKNERKAESGELFVTKIFVDGGFNLQISTKSKSRWNALSNCNTKTISRCNHRTNKSKCTIKNSVCSIFTSRLKNNIRLSRGRKTIGKR